MTDAPPRFPKRLFLVDRWFSVERVSLERLRDLAADHPDEALEGAHNLDLGLLAVLRTLPPARQWRVLGHEQAHALIDLLDRG